MLKIYEPERNDQFEKGTVIDSGDGSMKPNNTVITHQSSRKTAASATIFSPSMDYQWLTPLLSISLKLYSYPAGLDLLSEVVAHGCFYSDWAVFVIIRGLLRSMEMPLCYVFLRDS